MLKIQQYLNFLGEISNEGWRVVFENGRNIQIQRKDHNDWVHVFTPTKETLLSELRNIIRDRLTAETRES